MRKVLGILETVLKDCEDIEDRGMACAYDTNELRQAVKTVKDYLEITFIKVRIKTWEEMEKEFGLDEYGGIRVNFTFVEGMENLLLEDRIIKISKDEDGDNLWLGTRYCISEDMIAEYL